MTKGRRQLGIALALATASACMKPALSPAPPPSHAIASEVMALLNAPTSAGPAPAWLLQPSLPETFARALIPGGAEIAAIATGGSRTVVVARIPRRVSFFLATPRVASAGRRMDAARPAGRGIHVELHICAPLHDPVSRHRVCEL
jgi:hypothetical protein